MEHTPYPSALTDKEWQWIESLVPTPSNTGPPRRYPLRAILNAIFYVLRTGCQWRAMPHDLPHWQTAYHFLGAGGSEGGGGQKLNGRKRHLLVDTQGSLLKMKVHPADVMDRDGVQLLLLPAHTKESFRASPTCGSMAATMARTGSSSS